MVRQTSKWGQIFLASLVGLGATAFATAWFYRLDEVITVQGRLVPENGGVEVKSPMQGQLSAVLIRNGEQVVKNQKLLRFDLKAPEVEKQTIDRQLKLEKKSLQDKLSNNSKRNDTLTRNIALTQKIINRLLPLEKAGAISELQILKKKNQLENERDQLIQLQHERREMINKSQKTTAQQEGRLKQIDNQMRNEYVKAPIKGSIFDLKPDNDRYVAKNAEVLLKIVPRGKLGGEVNITNQDIGFIKKGQKVKVRINSFPYSEYGEIDGVISHIGADSLPPTNLIQDYHFPVDISLQRSKLKTRDGLEIPLQAGMTITTNLKLRDRRLIELLSDLFSNKGESLKRLRQP